jgi:hypothetical protein
VPWRARQLLEARARPIPAWRQQAKCTNIELGSPLGEASALQCRMAGLHLPAGLLAMAGNVPFLMKDVVLFAASVYLLKQDVLRVSISTRHEDMTRERT